MAAEPELETQIVVRPACDRDGESVGRFLVGLSPADRYQRFFSAFHYVSPELIQEMVTSTPTQLVRLALHGDAVVGHVMAVRADEHTADLGIVVAEAYQCQGIGSRLAHEMIKSLDVLGYTEMRCDVLSGNHCVLDWLRRLLPNVRFERSREMVTARGSLPTHAT